MIKKIYVALFKTGGKTTPKTWFLAEAVWQVKGLCD
jgi:hypothetical protein